MKPKVDVQQVFISTASIFGIGLLWINFNVKVIKTVRDLISVPVSDESENFWFKNTTLAYILTMSDNKPVKTMVDVATLTGFASGIGWISTKVIKENFTADSSSNILNYAKFTAVMAASITLKQYLEDQKILPRNWNSNSSNENG